MVIVWYNAEHQEFLKAVEGTGDNLLEEDTAEGYQDYFLYGTFSVGDMEICDEWELEPSSPGGQLLTRSVIVESDDPAKEYGETLFDMVGWNSRTDHITLLINEYA